MKTYVIPQMREVCLDMDKRIFDLVGGDTQGDAEQLGKKRGGTAATETSDKNAWTSGLW